MDLNKVMLIGRLTRDPEMRSTPNGTQVCQFSVATGRVYKDAAGQRQEKTEFHNIVAWRKLAEICGQYLKKGSQIYVEGRLETRSWEGNDGKKNYRTEIVMENMIMLGSKGGSGMGGGAGSFATASAGTGAQSEDAFMAAEEIPTINQDQPLDEISVEDVPF